MEDIQFEDFKKLVMRVGTIRFVEPVPETDKLLRFLIEFGEDVATMEHKGSDDTIYKVRQIVSGIREFYPKYDELVGKQALYILNLETRTIRGIESQGMLMAVGEGDAVFLVPDRKINPGPGSQVH